MATVSDTVVATELVSRPQKIAAPRYRYLKVYPTTGSGEIKIPADGRHVVQFEIPTQLFNYSKSYICGSLSTSEPAGGNGFCQYLYKDCVAWCNRLSFKTRGGATMIDLDYVNNYTKIVNKYETHMEDVMYADPSDALYSIRPDYSDVKIPAQRPDGKKISHPFVEATYVDPGEIKAAGPPAVSGVNTFNFRIPLSKLAPNTVLARKSDLKLPEIAILTLSLGPGTKISFEAKARDNPTTDVAPCTTETKLNNFFLHLAKQDDPLYESMYEERLRAGFEIPINVPIHSMYITPSSSDTQNISVTYNSGHGIRLVKIYHSVFNREEKANTAYDNSCESKTPKVKSYHIKLQGSRTSDDELVVDTESKTDPGGLSAYVYHKDLLEGTTITTSDIYKANFVHIEDVGRIGGPKRWKDLNFRKDDAEAGIPLTQDYKFEFNGTMTAAVYHHYTFAIVQRILKVNESMALVE